VRLPTGSGHRACGRPASPERFTLAGERRGARRPFGPRLLANRADKAKSFGTQRPDEALPGAAVADRAPRRVQLCVQHRLGNDAAAPDRVEHVFLADDAIPVADQEFQKIEDLRFERTRRAAAPQFTPISIEGAVIKPVNHVYVSSELSMRPSANNSRA
jgi:hypothetical protein